jgi:hypothetical protein
VRGQTLLNGQGSTRCDACCPCAPAMPGT